jgi:uncharacterized protein (TIGR03437 family)
MRIQAFCFLLAGVSVALAQGPVINSGGIGNLTTGQTPIAPGSLAVIFGTNLSSQIAQADTIPLSASLGGVTVQFVNGSNTFNAPLVYVAPTDPAHGVISQINAQVPWNLVPNGTTATVSVIVSHDGLSSAPASVTVGPFSPGIFAAGGRAIAVNLDGTLAWPSGSVPGTVTHPAKPGDVVILYVTGLGAVDSPIADGAASLDKLRNTLVKPVVLVGGLSAEVAFSGLTPQYPGVNQLNIVIPNAVPGDNVPIQIQVGGITSPNTTTLAVGK